MNSSEVYRLEQCPGAVQGHVTEQLCQWLMPVIKRSSSTSSADDTTENNMSSKTDQKLDLILKEISEIKSQNSKFSADISEMKDTIEKFKTDINETVDLCFAKLEDTNKIVKINKDNILFHETRIETLSSELDRVKKQVAELQQTVAVSNQYSRSNCLEIYGVPEAKNEDVMEVVKSVAKVLNFELKERMIDAVHRLAKNQRKPEAHRGIIVKFCRRIDMESLRSRTRVKNGFSAAELGMNSESKIFINLSLSPFTKYLWGEVRAFKNEHGYKYAWITSAGKVFLRKTDGSRPIHVSGKSDLDKLK